MMLIAELMQTGVTQEQQSRLLNSHSVHHHLESNQINLRKLWIRFLPSKVQYSCSQNSLLGENVKRGYSSPVEVLNFFQASLRNCKNCDYNCEDHSSFDFISAVHI